MQFLESRAWDVSRMPWVLRDEAAQSHDALLVQLIALQKLLARRRVSLPSALSAISAPSGFDPVDIFFLSVPSATSCSRNPKHPTQSRPFDAAFLNVFSVSQRLGGE